MPAPAGPPADQPIPASGGSTFAEDPARAAPDARIIWHADLDPGTLRVAAVPTTAGDAEGVDPDRLRAWLAMATDASGREHVVLSDGWHRVRLDIEDGSLFASAPVRLHYMLNGLASVEAKILPLRRFLDLCRRGSFGPGLFPADPRVERWLVVLRVRDALAAGASQREIGAALFGEKRIAGEWNGSTDSLRSRVRRLVREARAMAGGGYRRLMLKPQHGLAAPGARRAPAGADP